MFLLTLQSLHFSDMIEATFLHILQRAFALPALGFYHYHYSKTFSPKRFMISDLIFGRMFLQYMYLQPIITQYFIDNKSEIWLLFLIAHSKR